MRISGMLALIAVVVGCGGGDGPTNGGNNGGPVASVQITGGADMTIGQQRSLSAVLRNAQNQVLTGRTIAWSVNPTGIVSLSATSGAQITVEAEAAGTATVTATSEGESDTETITVEEDEPAPLTATVNALASSWSPAAVTIALNGKVTFNNSSGITHTLTFEPKPSFVTNDDAFVNEESHEFTFSSATGSPYSYHCSIHPGMNGTVTVVAP